MSTFQFCDSLPDKTIGLCTDQRPSDFVDCNVDCNSSESKTTTRPPLCWRKPVDCVIKRTPLDNTWTRADHQVVNQSLSVQPTNTQPVLIRTGASNSIDSFFSIFMFCLIGLIFVKSILNDSKYVR